MKSLINILVEHIKNPVESEGSLVSIVQVQDAVLFCFLFGEGPYFFLEVCHEAVIVEKVQTELLVQ